jgi:alanine dehydrogenase
MRIGIVKETKTGEGRVPVTPAVTREIVEAGHDVLFERYAGDAARFDDRLYEEAGAIVIEDPAEVWARAQLLLKVKEPQPEEFDLLHPGLTLFAYLHVAGNRALAEKLIEHEVTSIAFEAMEQDDGLRPILEPMLEIAGTMGMIHAFHYSSSTNDGQGNLPGGVAGVAPMRVRIFGANPMAVAAARAALGLNADVMILDPALQRLRRVKELLPAVQTKVAHGAAVAYACREADIVVNTIAWKAGRIGHLLSREHVRSMPGRSLVVDLAADEPGAVETSRPTTFDEPCYDDEGVTHFCVANIPSSVARSSTRVLSSSLQPFVQRIAKLGPRGVLRHDRTLRRGLVTIEGQVVDAATADWLGVVPVRAEMVLGLES